MSEREWWEPTLVDAALAKRLREDYGHGPEITDEQLFANYEYHNKYATTWDHIGDAYRQFEPLADDWIRLRAIEAAARALVDEMGYDDHQYDGAELKVMADLRAALDTKP